MSHFARCWGDYRVIYRIVEAGVQIVVVRHGARLLEEIREATE